METAAALESSTIRANGRPDRRRRAKASARMVAILICAGLAVVGGLLTAEAASPAPPAPAAPLTTPRPTPPLTSRPGPTVTSTRNGSAAVVALPDGTQLVVGGCAMNHCATVVTTASIYNPRTKTSTPTGSTITPHASATATLLPSGQVLLAGGCQGRYCGQQNPGSELWNPATGRWSATADLLATPAYALTPRNASAVLLPSGRVLVAGGTNYESIAQTYDPTTATWTRTTPMQAPRESFTLLTLPSGKVLAAGGCDGSYCQTILASAELYDPTTGSWTTTGTMREARYDHDATLLTTGRVRVSGGYDSTLNPATPDELYTPTTGTWTLAP